MAKKGDDVCSPYMALSADVLIVSGGSAGVMVAIRAKQMGRGERVVVFEKRDMRHSGGIARGMDAVVIVLLLPFTYYLGPYPRHRHAPGHFQRRQF